MQKTASSLSSATLCFETVSVLRNRLAFCVDNRYLSAADADFVQCALSDVDRFVSGQGTTRVLLFPPVSSYHRYLLHHTIAEYYPFLCTISIGEGDERRTVVYFGEHLHNSIKSGELLLTTGIKRARIDDSEDESEQKAMTTASDTRVRPINDKKPSRKPDMAMYVPKGRRQPFGWTSDGHMDSSDCGSLEADKQPDMSVETVADKASPSPSPSPKSVDPFVEQSPPPNSKSVDPVVEQSPPLITFDSMPTPPPSVKAPDQPARKLTGGPPQPQPNKLPSQIIREMMLKSGLVADSNDSTAAADPIAPQPPMAMGPPFDTRASSSSQFVPSPEDHILHGAKPVSSFLAPRIPFDRGDSILDCLPTSYDEFETTELHMRLERQISSPLTSPTGLVSPQVGAVGVKGGSEQLSCSPPPDAEDMEVAMINESFEEQQKQTQLYDSADLKCLFYSRPNANQSTVKSTASSDHSGSSSVFDQSPALLHLATSGAVVADAPQLPKPAIAWAGWGKKPHPPTPPDTPKATDYALPFSLTPTDTSDVSTSNAFTTAEMLAVDMAEKLLEDDEEETDVAQSLNSSPSLEVFAANSDSEKPNPRDRALRPADGAESLTFSSTDCFRTDNECAVVDDISSTFPSDLSPVYKTNVTGSFVADDDTADSWEQLCDDETGELDPKVIQEINWALGKVKVEQPKFDYLAFKPKPIEFDQDEMAHVLEIYGFPKATKTDELRAALADLNCRHFDVKWVDDDHALAVFASADAAFEPQIGSHSLIKLRPLSAATPQSQRKAKQSAEFLQPFKARPPTNALLARRMVESALGKRSSVTAEQRSSERKQLIDAKDRKQHLAALWEGNV